MTTLYRFFDADDRLLYVGIAGTATRRWEQHAKEKGWWDSVARVTVENHPNRAAAENAERIAIQAELPIHNVVHNRAKQNAKHNRAKQNANHDRAIWLCDVCRSPVENGSGYVQSVKAVARKWVVLHRDCDPFPDDPGYWFAVERLRTEDHELDWFMHLGGKCWFDPVDWHDLLDRSFRLPGENRPEDKDQRDFLRAMRALWLDTTKGTQ